MLTLRKAQISILQQSQIEQFIANMVAHIAREYTTHHARLGSENARAFIKRSIEAATALGIKTAGSVGALIELWLVYGEQFERAPDRQWVRNILSHPTLPDYIKVGAIQDRLAERAGGRVLVAHQEPV